MASRQLKEPAKNIDPNYETKQNLVGFFNLLFEVDKRVNPHLYQRNDENNGSTNNAD